MDKHEEHNRGGRPTLFQGETKDVTIRLSVALLDWLDKDKTGIPMSVQLRTLIYSSAHDLGYKNDG